MLIFQGVTNEYGKESDLCWTSTGFPLPLPQKKGEVKQNLIECLKYHHQTFEFMGGNRISGWKDFPTNIVVTQRTMEPKSSVYIREVLPGKAPLGMLHAVDKQIDFPTFLGGSDVETALPEANSEFTPEVYPGPKLPQKEMNRLPTINFQRLCCVCWRVTVRPMKRRPGSQKKESHLFF